MYNKVNTKKMERVVLSTYLLFYKVAASEFDIIFIFVNEWVLYSVLKIHVTRSD